MKFVLYTNVVSAHQLPFAWEMVRRLGAESFRYVYTGEADGVRQEIRCDEPWIVRKSRRGQELGVRDGESVEGWKIGEIAVDRWLEECEVLLVGGIRPIDLMERRLAAGRLTLYMTERWFKPFHGLPGWVRLLVPSYFKMARRFAKFFECTAYLFLPIGPWAERDMRLLCRVMGRTMPLEKVIPWGYFVAPSSLPQPPPQTSTSKRALRVLWVGRMIGWKRVDTLSKAVQSLDANKYSLTLVGSGDQKEALIRLAGGASNIDFRDSVPITEMRDIMRQHDVYVLASNAEEGWGAALNEAMEEGLNVLGTYEAGASAAMLPDSHLFHAGDWRALAKLLENLPPKVDMPVDYTAHGAAARMMELIA